MTGLDKILETIGQSGEEKAEKTILKYETKAKEISDEYEEKTKREYDEIISKAEKKADFNIENALLTAKLNSSEEVLALKSKLIDKALQTAIEKLESIESEKYFSLLYKLVSSKPNFSGATIIFNERDKNRLPEKFIEELNLSEKTADIKGGFILSYGDIEENCSLDALVKEKRDIIRDEAAKILFLKGES